MPPPIFPLLEGRALDQLRTAMADYTVESVHELLGPLGRSAHERGDLLGVERVLPVADRIATLVRLFLLGAAVPEADAAAALAPLALDAAKALVATGAGEVRARLEVRPYAADDVDVPWWVLSDFGSHVRPGPLADDHVLGIGAASLTLAQAVVRRPVERALDLGTGCGVQALHLSTHVRQVVATDVSDRALRMAATTAALSGQTWQLRSGSLLEPVAGSHFDVVVANPPFVVSPGLARGAGGFDYRDSGLAGDTVSANLLRGIPALLAPEGTASVLVNWIVPPDGDWVARVEEWLAGSGCDAWIWQREVVEPAAYVSLWLRDAGEVPGSPRWRNRYTAWLDWFDAAGVAAVGMGLAALRRTDRSVPIVVCEDVPQAITPPAGLQIAGWFVRQRWLADHDDDALLGSALQCAGGVARTRHDLPGPSGWQTELQQLRQQFGMRWEIEADDAVAGLVVACTGAVPLGVLLDVLARSLGADAAEVAGALLPVVRDLVGRGFLEPSGAR